MLTPEQILTHLQHQLPHIVSGQLVYGYLKSQHKQNCREWLIAEYCLERAFERLYFSGIREHIKLKETKDSEVRTDKLFECAVAIGKLELTDV